ncbi:hypothetical protein CL653_02120 [bacterium]|nr:hypothetical protein [bacterium]|tara:strand:+ start:677 stop:967 length:291 start_codon:yes stop_codon:yes gene_type:complete
MNALPNDMDIMTKAIQELAADDNIARKPIFSLQIELHKQGICGFVLVDHLCRLEDAVRQGVIEMAELQNREYEEFSLAAVASVWDPYINWLKSGGR